MSLTDLIKFEKQWGVSEDDPHLLNEDNMITLVRHVFGNMKSIGDADQKCTSYIGDIIEILNNCKPDFETKVRINRLLELSYYAKNVAIGLKRMSEIMELPNDYRNNNDISLFRFKTIELEENSRYQNFLLYALGYMYNKGYRRYNESVYAPIINSDGNDTRAWKKVGTISEILYKSIVKETNYDQFLNATGVAGSIKSATEFLANCEDPQFPQLKKDRRVFSFKNGIYFAKDQKLKSYGASFEDVISSKYFDYDFPMENEECPYLESILDYQDIDEETKWIIYVMIGRLIYEIDELDGWQVVLFFQGQAGTGKSTIAQNVCKQIYDDEDVGTITNNFQQTFGLADIAESLIWIAPEIKKDFKMCQAEFQSIVSGDPVAINIKYKQSKFITWKIPGMLCGNEPPDFVDNSGSFQRRILPVKMPNKVKNGDLTLGRKIQKEMPHIIKKANEAYLDAVNSFGRKDIWGYLPKSFHEARIELAASTNSLLHFLGSGKLVFGEDKFIPECLFKDAFNSHCQTSNYKRQKWNKDFYSGPFFQYNISVEKKGKKKYEGRTLDGPFFIGVDVQQEGEEIEDEF
jgi:phage/plasmid-associated DNA primase